MSNTHPAESAAEEIARLTAELDALRGRAGAALGRASKEATRLVGETREVAARESEALAQIVRQRPLTSLALAGAFGFLIGRLVH